MHQPGQIADGQTVAVKLGLQNVDLRPMDIMDLTDEVGRFHYIIAHGVYSWVAPDVQEKILQICKRSLAPRALPTSVTMRILAGI